MTIVFESPFPHQGPLPPQLVTGRDDLIEELIERITARRVTALLGPRRYGKTSVLRRVAADLDEAGTSAVWVDLYEVTSMADLAIRLDRALGATRGRLGELVRSIAASLSFSVGGVSVSFTKPQRPDPTATVHVLLDVLVRTALDQPTLLVIDEFSSIRRIDGGAGLLRTALQHHYADLGIVFAGSEPSTMRMLFSGAEQPFYGQADLLVIPPLSASAVHTIVTDGFRATDRDPGPLPGLVHDLCAGHPRRTMQLADAAWQHAAPDQRWTDATWTRAVADLRRTTGPACESLFSSLPAAEQKVLRVLAAGGSVWGRDAEVVGLRPSSVGPALRSLDDGGHIDADRLTVIDPVFADWVRARVPITDPPTTEAGTV